MEGTLEYLNKESLTFKGYVQQISYKPFNTVLYTEKSLTAANKHIRVGGGVLHIDATGSMYTCTKLVKKSKILCNALVLNTSGVY